MRKLDFIRAESLSQALETVGFLKNQAVITAGSTDVMVELRAGRINPEITAVVDISRIGEMDYIIDDDGIIRIGACTTHSVVSHNSLIKKYAPVLSKASGLIGSVQTRNRGTIGGNLVTAAQCADTIPPLLVLDASVVIRSTEGVREISVEKMLAEKGNGDPVNSGEILTEIYFKKPGPGTKSVFDKLIRRKAVAKSRINFCAMALQESSGKIADIRIAPGAVTPYHMRFREAESILLGRVPDRNLVESAADKVSAMMVELAGERWSTPYKKPVLKIMAERGLNSILEVVDGQGG